MLLRPPWKHSAPPGRAESAGQAVPGRRSPSLRLDPRYARGMDKPTESPKPKPEPGTPTGYMTLPPGGDRDALGRPWPEVKVPERKTKRRKR
jgi:hypothetical protein